MVFVFCLQIGIDSTTLRNWKFCGTSSFGIFQTQKPQGALQPLVGRRFQYGYRRSTRLSWWRIGPVMAMWLAVEKVSGLLSR